ncbi:MFS transporter [Aneurinibacillus aneurinilyticus]|uniref:Transporter, major facilitator family protein n=1 Tax=Aneurinibacillus aneurinilyticus ATCC 12856 TaxID=649747 RepID=U1YC71_ANEAE|nr:MFS transporter [Aneurinibacillus aneurinilyticus]ERI08396.1 transporter, major facilitator family protein [Aneurinibacillus aneurinilyticus ATCC 12856]MED0704599.1 MFS transporter [Aneurinibacillus aneurinilyticus]MED0725190.1 MFS transporter [Aneurinibacillus aneurinilyticus]MED0735039.1 MFS transporter [Aneurinibacillus aneurinilyticus]MED0742456.1 MFS transporter [Aneurinibacillus aneurinilyticus]
MNADSAQSLSAQNQPAKQPLVIWVIFFATIISFMGLGLVDPILPAIAEKLRATPSQVSLLFSSYNLITGVAMLITGVVSSRVGIKWTLLTGIIFIIVFSALAGSSNGIWQIVGFRGGWGLGNSLFIATALSAIVGLSVGGTAKAIILYEAAIGLGISVGPLLGGELGSISWRGPFYGVSVLMLIAFFALLLKMPQVARPKVKSSILDPIKALKFPGLLRLGLTAFLYNIGFFTLMAYAPFVMGLDEHGLGYVFLGWGLCLAITSVFVAPKLQARFGTIKSMCAMLILFAFTLLAMGIWTDSRTVIIVSVIIAGLFLGTNNTLITTAVMQVAPVERATASAAYSFVRFIGGAIGPWLANKLAEAYTSHVPFITGAMFVFVAMLVVALGRGHIAHVDRVSSH